MGKPSLSNNQMGFLEIKDAVVKFAAPKKGLLTNVFTISTSGEDIRIRIAQDENTEAKVNKVNALWHKKVDLVIHRSPWSVGDKSGVSNFLQSIEESK
jgi:hypothetical protein